MTPATGEPGAGERVTLQDGRVAIIEAVSYQFGPASWRVRANLDTFGTVGCLVRWDADTRQWRETTQKEVVDSLPDGRLPGYR